MALTPKQQKFVLEYLQDGNATRSAKAAGYSARSASTLGERLLRDPKVKAELDRRMGKLMSKLEITAERVLQERARLAFFDVRKLFDADGNPLPIGELDDDTAAAIAGLDVERLFDGTGKGRKLIGDILKYKLADKNASLTALDKHLGLYKDESGDSAPLSIHIHL